MANIGPSSFGSFAYPAALAAKDRSLSLRSGALDFGGSATSTELDSLRSVLKKNIESGFSTFNHPN